VYHPTKDEFLRLADRSNIIPVYKEVLEDIETPLSSFRKLGGEYSFLLESAETAEKIGRYSFLGVNPKVFFRVFEKNTCITKGENEEMKEIDKDPLIFLKEIISSYKIASKDSFGRLFGGAVGFIGYDYIRFIENLPPKKEDELNLPIALFVIPENIIIFDHLNRTIKILALIPIKKNKIESYKESLASIEAIEKKLKKPFVFSDFKVKRSKPVFETKKSNFIKWVLSAKEYIRQGDIIQVVLSHRIKRKTQANYISIYRALRYINPSPYMFLLNFGDIKLIGSSPEKLVSLEGDIVETRPIAGTRKRGKTEEEDKVLEKELLACPKELSEHIMLVDLGRNDIGRVCEFGSVNVQEFKKIERYSHAMHIVSSIQGKIKKGLGPFELLQASFPAGTVTGAPKIRACEIIDELEDRRRGPYAGAVGYISFFGDMDTCITIRTILLYNGTAYIQAGAGIVAESDPEKEYQESLNKASAMLSAIDMAEDGLEL